MTCWCFTHLEDTLRQLVSDLCAQVGAENEEADLGPCDVGIIQQSLSGELQTAGATVSPRSQDGRGGAADQVQVSRHGLHSHIPGVTAHRERNPWGKK